MSPRAGEHPGVTPDYLLRPILPGDMGWILQSHGVLYHRDFRCDRRFEAMVAQIVADFLGDFDPARERGWIAERGGERVGSVLLVRHPGRPGVARLRVLLVEPSARGLGIGDRLVEECTLFARAVGYRTITLSTNSVLTAARRIYQRAGYRLVHSEPDPFFGPGELSETWELDLGAAPPGAP
jgi:GNAT superfamily N-acetyltransferase